MIAVCPGYRAMRPREWTSTQASAPPLSLMVRGSGCRGFRLGNPQKRRPAADCVPWPPAGRLILTFRYSQVVDGNVRSLLDSTAPG